MWHTYKQTHTHALAHTHAHKENATGGRELGFVGLQLQVNAILYYLSGTALELSLANEK